MKRLFLFALLLCASCFVGKADTTNYVATITFTNVVAGVTNGDTITVNGDIRRYTNGVLNDPALWILSTNIVGHAATNTLLHLATYPVTGVDFYEYESTNAFKIRSQIDETLTVTLSSGIGTVSYVTNVYAALRPVLLPIDSLLVPATRTNAQDRLVSALNLSYATGKVDSAASIMTNFVNLFASQTLSNKFVFTLQVVELSATNGTLSGQHITNATLISGTFGMGTNGTFQNPTINQAISISGNLGSITNGTSYGLSLVNVAALSGVMTALTNGFWTNAILSGPTFTNAINYGNPFSSPGSGSLSEQYGNQASATGDESVAVGFGAASSGYISAAFGSSSTASGGNSGAFGSGASATATNATALGPNSVVQADHGAAIGANTTVGAAHTNSIALGTGSTTSAKDQVILGASTHTVVIPGMLSITGTQTNTTFTGTNHLHGAISLNRRTDSSQPTGHNIITNSTTDNLVWLTSPSGSCTNVGFTDGWDGRIITYVKYNGGYNMGIANESGLASAERRVLTGTGADVTITNSPGWFKLLYDETIARWVLVGHSD